MSITQNHRIIRLRGHSERDRGAETDSGEAGALDRCPVASGGDRE